MTTSQGLKGKVAIVTGAARGNGRGIAVRLAKDGATVIAVDICAQIESIKYRLASQDDLAESARLITKAGGEAVQIVGDVRDRDAMQKVASEAIDRFGAIDIVVANAGITPFGPIVPGTDPFKDSIDVMLTGVYNVVDSAIPHIISGGRGGSIVVISSTAGLRGLADVSPGTIGYGAAKHGVVGLMRNWAKGLGKHNIRANTVHPTGCETPAVMSPEFQSYYAANKAVMVSMENVLPVSMLQPEDLAECVYFLCSDAGRFITGQTVAFDAGATL